MPRKINKQSHQVQTKKCSSASGEAPKAVGFGASGISLDCHSHITTMNVKHYPFDRIPHGHAHFYQQQAADHPITILAGQVPHHSNSVVSTEQTTSDTQKSVSKPKQNNDSRLKQLDDNYSLQCATGAGGGEYFLKNSFSKNHQVPFFPLQITSA